MHRVRDLVSKKTWNRNTRMKKYLLIADEKGIDAALEELERDKRFRAIPTTTYYYIKRRLLGLKSQIVVDYPTMFLKFLTVLAESDKDKIRKEELAEKLNCSVEVVEKLMEWTVEKDLVKVVKLLVAGKRAKESQEAIRKIKAR